MKTSLLCFTIALLIAASALGRPKHDTSQFKEIHQKTHWSHMPVLVYFAPSEEISPRETQAHKDAVLAGFDEWNAATHGAITSVVITNPAQADITVSFDTHQSLPGLGTAVGNTVTTFSGPVLYNAEMALAVGEDSAQELQTAAAHEFGHALGISTHSRDPNDLMYSSITRTLSATGNRLPAPVHMVTAHDLDALSLCYPDLLASRVLPSRGGAWVRQAK